MIGSVSVTRGTFDGKAILNDDRTWSYEGPEWLVRVIRLATLAIDVEDEGPADGPFGTRRLEAVSALLKGSTIQYEAKTPHPAGTIY